MMAIEKDEHNQINQGKLYLKEHMTITIAE